MPDKAHDLQLMSAEPSRPFTVAEIDGACRSDDGGNRSCSDPWYDQCETACDSVVDDLESEICGLSTIAIESERRTLPIDSNRDLSRLTERLTACDTGPGWIVNAPDLEQAIQKLLVRLGRMPSDPEIAKELRLDLTSYRDMLGYLTGLTMDAIYGKHEMGAKRAPAIRLSRNPHDEAVFQCLLCGTQDLLRGAIENVSDPERIVLTYDYCETIGAKDIWVQLDLRDSSLPEGLASARLHLYASLFDARRDAELGGPWSRLRAEGKDRQIAHVILRGSQDGWLPTRKVWERFGKQALWKREFTSSYAFDGLERLSQFRRKEGYHLNIADE